MLTAAHEFCLTDFGRAVQSTLDCLPINRSLLRITLESNLSLRSSCTGFSATPDHSLFASPVEAGPGVLLAVVECAFSQSREDVMKKVRAEVEGWPTIVLVILIFISEDRDYHSPKEGTPTWSFFSQCDACFLEDNFFALPRSIEACTMIFNESTSSDSSSTNRPEVESPTRLDPSSSIKQDLDSKADFEPEPVVIEPIVVADHTWCAIKEVEFDVWIREDGAERIDLDNSKRVIGVSDAFDCFMTCRRSIFLKHIYLRIKMEEAERVIGKGLSAAKKEICKLANVFKSKSALCRLQAAELGVEFNWRVMQSGLKISSCSTAWSRYENWYFTQFRGIKHAHSDDEEYEPTDNRTPSTSPEPRDVAPRSAARRKSVRR
ncbi:hypothetical protein PISMIDRAFT_17770 [Pisolithus microcarpus 441]|uniref:Uncharacterized protein n=1 Tax=Pisolithus microcarpus 441 TaxID=765257 RepID=A0A0C9XMW2_9AGAM|nr:hypothetical protein PISMIDRAFT_17770 [Pisolithus microcarpus 441]